jgi:hypothetical protein
MEWQPIAAIIVVIVISIYVLRPRENYVSKREKAEVISEWWKKEKSPNYNAYKSAINDSDSVEYYKIKKLVLGGQEPSIDVILPHIT